VAQKKLKPSWVKTDIPRDIKVKYLWRAMIGNPTLASWQQAMTRMDWEKADEQYYRASRDTYNCLRDEILEMPEDEFKTLLYCTP